MPTLAAADRSKFPIRLIAAPFTPLQEDGSLNLGMVEKYADRLVSQGVAGVFVCGTTGEGMSLTQSERKALAEAWKSAVDGRIELIVHVGHSSIDEARELARHAEKIHADGIASVGPIFFEPASKQELIELNQKIASAAPETSFYYYHMPSMCRAKFEASSWFEEMAAAIPTFRGVKFTHEDIKDYHRCLELAAGRYEVFFGRDELLLDGLMVGAISAVGSTYNFAAPLYHRIAQAFRAGHMDEAQRLQTFATDAINCMISHGGMTGIKATLALSGIDCGPLRLPLKLPSRREVLALEKELNALGYFEAIRCASRELLPSGPSLSIA